MDTYMTVKGQVVIPSKVRRQLGVKAGTRIHVEVEEAENRIILTPITRQYVQKVRGKYRGRRLLVALSAEKSRESER